MHKSKSYVIFARPYRKLLLQVNHGGNVNVMLSGQAAKRLRGTGCVREAPL